jgi:hypothetical protein
MFVGMFVGMFVWAKTATMHRERMIREFIFGFIETEEDVDVF